MDSTEKHPFFKDPKDIFNSITVEAFFPKQQYILSSNFTRSGSAGDDWRDSLNPFMPDGYKLK